MHPSPSRSPVASRRPTRAVLRRAVDIVAITIAFAVVLALTLPLPRTDVASAPVAARAPL